MPLKLPDNNLGPVAQPWARWADESLRELYDRADKLAIDDGINSRSAHAVVDNLSFQIRDLKSRQPKKVTLGAASSNTSGTFTLAPVTFDGPLTGGNTLFKGNFTVSSSSSGAGPAINVSIALNGTTILDKGLITFQNSSIPPVWYFSQPKNVNFFGTSLLKATNTLTVTYYVTHYFSSTWTINGNIAVFPE